MARRGCASGRRKQLRRLVKALHEQRDFDPSIFDRATPAQPAHTAPPPPAYIGHTQPRSKIRPTPANKLSRVRIPARPTASDVAPVRQRTRPLPVSAQIKRRDRNISKTDNKPTILSVKTTHFNIHCAGKNVFIQKRINPIKGYDSVPLNVTTGDSGGIPGIPV